MYALGPNHSTYGLFLDEPRRITWDFTTDLLLVTAPTGAIRGYVLLGDDLPQVRRRFMALVGRPPVPPKPAFGLWLSKYGYRSWDEVRAELTAMRAAHIPVDGVVLHDSINHNKDMPEKNWFWGSGGMLDWSQEKIPSFWHNTKRAPLVDAGVLGFWTDLS